MNEAEHDINGNFPIIQPREGLSHIESVLGEGHAVLHGSGVNRHGYFITSKGFRTVFIIIAILVLPTPGEITDSSGQMSNILTLEQIVHVALPAAEQKSISTHQIKGHLGYGVVSDRVGRY